MKRMSCNQLGGACEKQFEAESFEEMTDKSKKHAMEMLEIGDQDHIEAMKRMQKLMQSPEEMQSWFDQKKKEFEELSDQ